MPVTLLKETMDFDELNVTFEHCHDAVVVLTATLDKPLDGPIVYLNRAFTKQTGHTLEQLHGQPARTFLGSENPSPSPRPEDQPVRLEVRVRCKNGSDVRMPAAAWQIPNSAKQKKYVVLQQREPQTPGPDTGSHPAHTYELGEILARTFNRLPAGLVIIGRDGKILDLNPAAEGVLGYTRREALGNKLDALVPELSSNGTEVMFAHGGLERLWLKATMVTPSDSDLNVAIWMIRNITAESALAEANDQFETFAANSTTATWIADYTAQTMLFVNPAFKAITGYNPESLPCQNRWCELIHPADRERFYEEIDQTPIGQPLSQKFRILRKDGSVRWLQSRAFPLKNPLGDFDRIGGLLEDITEQEQVLADLQTAVAAKQTLLQEVHHRVKNNLQIISSLMRLQEKEASHRDPVVLMREARRRVEAIALLHERLCQSEDPTQIDLRFYTERLTANLEGSAQKNVTFTMQMERVLLDSKDCMLCGLILNELLTNCLNHAFPDGKKGEVTIRSKVSGDRIALEVSDNGVGLPQPPHSNGEGLGLKLVRRLTSQLKGTVSFSNQKGLSARIEFPFGGRVEP